VSCRPGKSLRLQAHFAASFERGSDEERKGIEMSAIKRV
jgi:hypothetical protein